LELIAQSVPAPQTTVQPAIPAHETVPPPFGHSIAHVLLPVQATVDPVSTNTWQSLPLAQPGRRWEPIIPTSSGGRPTALIT
jgi:hypothetical protein